MLRAMTSAAERILHTTGPGGLELTGALFGDPAAGSTVVFTHGGAGRFCERTYVELGRQVADRGHAMLSGETRGRDVVAVQEVDGQAVPLGATFERFADSIGDLAAWAALARELRADRLVLGGHSLGAAKAVRALPSTAATGLLLLSPVVSWPDNTDRISMAGELTRAGRGGELMPPHPQSPPWDRISAATLHERATLIENAFEQTDSPWSAVDVPTLVLFGGAEEDPGPALERLRAGWAGRGPLDCRVIDGAGHYYRQYESQVADTVAGWLAALEPAQRR
jgi:pimeloyl-ACP methyl ester carboxylesterase